MRKMLEQHLARAEQHVTTGERIVARQKAIVAGLARDDHDTRAARLLLRQLEELLVIFIAYRDRLRADLAKRESLHRSSRSRRQGETVTQGTSSRSRPPGRYRTPQPFGSSPISTQFDRETLQILQAVYEKCVQKIHGIYGDTGDLVKAREQLIATRIMALAEHGALDPDLIEKQALAGLMPEYPH